MNTLSEKAQAVVDHVDSIAHTPLLSLSGVSFSQFLLTHKRFPIIAVTGQSGVGKTTFTNLCIQHLEAALEDDIRLIGHVPVKKLVELPQMSPYLAAIKASSDGLGQEVWEKNQELFRVLDASIITNAFLQSKESIVVMDFSIIQVLVFAFLKIQGKSRKKFTTEFNSMFQKLPKPDFVIQIQADPDVVLSRIAQRGTYIDSMLEHITRELHTYYNMNGRDIIGEYYKTTPVISIDTTNLNLKEDLLDQTAATKIAVQEVLNQISKMARNSA